MRFKATLNEVAGLIQILQALERVGSECLVLLSDTHVKFNQTAEFTDGEQAFAESKHDNFFTNWRIQSKANNQIMFQLNIPNFLRAIRTGQSSPGGITLKLSKRGTKTFLHCDMKIDDMKIEQEVGIDLQSAARLMQCQQPNIPAPKVKFHMPDLQQLTTIIQRMQQLDEFVIITASSAGDVTFEVNTDMVTVSTFYKNRAMNAGLSQTQGQSQSSQTSGGGDPNEPLVSSSVRIDVSKLARVLQCRSLNASKTIGCLVERHAFVCYVILKHGMGTVTYYIPIYEDE